MRPAGALASPPSAWEMTDTNVTLPRQQGESSRKPVPVVGARSFLWGQAAGSSSLSVHRGRPRRATAALCFQARVLMSITQCCLFRAEAEDSRGGAETARPVPCLSWAWRGRGPRVTPCVCCCPAAAGLGALSQLSRSQLENKTAQLQQSRVPKVKRAVI